MNFNKLAKQEEELLIKYRRYLHENPELSGKEYNTLAFIKSELDKMNINYVEVKDGGILGFIDGKHDGKTVLLRADIDALPIHEDILNGGGIKKTCVSKIDNVQHACGHDAHTAILLVTAKILNEHKDDLNGKVVFCFERGEEGNGNIFYLLKYFEDNNMTFDSCFGMHVGSLIKGNPGDIFIKPDAFMAGMTSFRIAIKGKGGHGSRPDITNNPIDCFTAIYNSLASLRMKTVNPFAPLTYSIGHLSAGSKNNIIPDRLTFAGTIRYFDHEVGNLFLNNMRKVIDNTAKAYECEVDYEDIMIPGYPVNNDPACTKLAQVTFSKIYDSVKLCEPVLGTESFSFYQLKTPGVFAFLCTYNDEKGMIADHHTAQFDIDEEVLYRGVACYVSYAIDFLNSDITPNINLSTQSVDDLVLACGRKL